MRKPKVLLPFPRVIHIVYPTQRTLANKFMRMQEFYESSLLGFRGQRFTRKEFKKAYMEDRGASRFTYHDDWGGFNVPGRVANKFMRMFTPDSVERDFLKLINKHKPTRGRYYVIGTYESDDSPTVSHELSHAFWELDPRYKANAMRFVKALPRKFYNDMLKQLRELGYCEEVLDDEVTAYLSTSTMPDLVDVLNERDLPWSLILQFQENFEDYLIGKRLGKK